MTDDRHKAEVGQPAIEEGQRMSPQPEKMNDNPRQDIADEIGIKQPSGYNINTITATDKSVVHVNKTAKETFFN